MIYVGIEKFPQKDILDQDHVQMMANIIVVDHLIDHGRDHVVGHVQTKEEK